MIYIKKIFFLLLILIGYSLIYIEYNKLIGLNFSFKKTQIFNDNIKNDRANNNKINIDNDNSKKINDFIKKNVEFESALNKVVIVLEKGDTFYSILSKFNFSDKRIFEIIDKVENYFNLKRLKINEKIIFYKDLDEKIKKIQIN